MIIKDRLRNFKIVFFSGTGSTARVADTFEKSLKAKGKNVKKYELNNKSLPEDDKEDMLIIVYPVHACNAPESVYEYIHSISKAEGMLAAVISVSGGGEITPNTACRLHCIKRLERKGFKVVYEEMIVMPSNWIVATIDALAVRLLEVLPIKVEKITNELICGVIRRTKPNLINRLLSCIGELEKYGARMFGNNIKVNENCYSCGWCQKACPRGNIALEKGRPHFNNRCILCLKCIYGCPQKALAPGIAKFVVINQGYSLNDIEKLSYDKQESVEKLAKGYLWKGIKEYLLSDR